MMKNENYKNLLEAIKQRKPLLMDLGDGCYFHMKWDADRVTPDGIKGCYVDEMGMTSMKLIQDIIQEKVYINERKITIREDK